MSILSSDFAEDDFVVVAEDMMMDGWAITRAAGGAMTQTRRSRERGNIYSFLWSVSYLKILVFFRSKIRNSSSSFSGEGRLFLAGEEFFGGVGSFVTRMPWVNYIERLRSGGNDRWS